MIVSTDAIVLNSRRLGDSSKILVLFTRDYGKISLIAKGAFNAKSKLGSLVEPMSILNITFYKKPNQTLHLLSKVESKYNLKKVYSDSGKLSASLLTVESYMLLLEENYINEKLFEVLESTIMNIEKESSEPFLDFLICQIKIADLMGYGLSFDGEFLENISEHLEYYISLNDCNISNQMYHRDKKFFKLKGEFLLSLILIANNESSDEDRLSKIISQCRDEAFNSKMVEFFIEFFSYHLGRKLNFKSYKILSNL